MNKTILVTGGTGYIGSHTVVELQQSGYNVIIVDNLSNSNIEILDSIEKITGIKPKFEKLDLVDEKKTREFFIENKNIEAVIHFAAYKAVGESVELPLKYYKNNLCSLINIIENMREHDIKNIVFSSSCTVYGQPEQLPVTESAPILKALSPYGNTKQVSEEIIYDTVQQNNINCIALRYFNPIGAHKSGLIGELPLGVPNNLLPYLMQVAVGKRDYLRVFGNDYETKDGTCIRDYIHVTDLAKAHVIALKRLLENKNKDKYEVFNLGTGKGYTVLEVIKSFEKVTQKELPYKILERRAGDITAVYADTAYANNELGWKAQLELDDMVLSAWVWEQHYMKY